MRNRNCKLFVFVFIIIASFSTIMPDNDLHKINCKTFSSVMRRAKRLVESGYSYNLFLEESGFVTRASIFGIDSYNKSVENKVEKANTLTIGAQIFKSEFNMPLDYFESLAYECTKDRTFSNLKKNVNTKYRSIDGRGNNLNYPEWGASDTPFSRFGSKNYEDGIYTIKKSVTGSDLPNARLLVQEVLLKAVRSPPPPITFNLMGLLIILFATHDLHYQVPVHTKDRKNEVRCCSKDSRDTLPPVLSNSACLPIEVSTNDPFYKHARIGCLNMLRSQLGEYTNGVHPGEILNRATAYLDLSLIYGNYDSELIPIRLFKGGQLRLGKNKVLPVLQNGKHLPSMDRFITTPIASIWPALFSRNHNHLAERLAKLNSHWNDETLFQEARRINIANFQFNLITSGSIEKVFNTSVNVTYSDKRNAGTFVEFAFTYRGGHYFIPSNMLFMNENYTESKHLQSDTIGKIELLENDFDDALRGAINQPLNVGQYSDEIINRIGKNHDGYGIDLIAIDIQRGRDHGIPSFVEIRRKCKLSPEINSFDDFNKIFNKTNVDLLRNIYKSHEDVDFYVGGLLEAFEHVANPFAGPTFGCIVGENYKNVVGGDIYYFSHPQNPHPFTEAQKDSVIKYSVTNLYCTNSGLKEINRLWSYAPHPINPKVDCKNYPPMDLTAWKESVPSSITIFKV